MEPGGGEGKVNGVEIRSTGRISHQKQNALYLFTEGFHHRWTCRDLAEEHHILVSCCQGMGASSPGRRADAERGARASRAR